MSRKVLLVLGVLAVFFGLNGAVRRFGWLDVSAFVFVVGSLVMLGLLAVVAYNE